MSRRRNNIFPFDSAKKINKYMSRLKMKLKPMPKIKIRNPVALSPLLQKGGIHESEKAQAQHRKSRKDAKQVLNKTNWL
jgi:hypothetical protein